MSIIHNYEHLKKLVFKGAENKKVAITDKVLERIRRKSYSFFLCP